MAFISQLLLIFDQIAQVSALIDFFLEVLALLGISVV